MRPQVRIAALFGSVVSMFTAVYVFVAYMDAGYFILAPARFELLAIAASTHIILYLIIIIAAVFAYIFVSSYFTVEVKSEKSEVTDQKEEAIHERVQPEKSEETVTFREIRKWPSQFDYAQAFQNPSYSLSGELSGYRIIRNPNVKMAGNTIYSSGNYGIIFKLENNGAYYAIKCFTKGSDLHRRYFEIGRHLQGKNIPCIVHFEYIENGVRTMKDPSLYYPVLKMDWVDGDSLYTFLKKNIDNGREIRRIAGEFLNMVMELKMNKMAHGDLSCDNILISNGRVIFVDYDGMYVPALKNMPSSENGHENFQRPDRKPSDFSENMDDFSALVIYTSLYVLSLRPEAWKFNGDDPDALLFRKADFLNPEKSEVFAYIKSMGGKSWKLASMMIKALGSSSDRGIDLRKAISAR
ncbi:RIO1 family regulatory kinase/ATPase [Thermoplasma sp.]|uniref:RIO1 family regulatory kinase/ATPase n=1 Tax=Thermoplasma sp. TaxID=1973142 RepID=UPI0012776ECC|nr:RIO1 family regulatory kinase/ATPase [Thermoplasma sp.]KAA8923427.1 MAG: protein kinase family protein [Thermoplasma sp.]